MADNTIDTLNIQIDSSTTHAVRSINNLVKKLDTLNSEEAIIKAKLTEEELV